MIIYNVTINIDFEVEKEWVNWMKGEHIPEVMATGCFIESRMTKVIAEDEGGSTYAIMYLCYNMEIYERYKDKYAPGLQAAHANKYSGKFAAFRTLLDVIHQTK
jgi:Domain of unknown function (DUF4286)